MPRWIKFLIVLSVFLWLNPNIPSSAQITPTLVALPINGMYAFPDANILYSADTSTGQLTLLTQNPQRLQQIRDVDFDQTGNYILFYSIGSHITYLDIGSNTRYVTDEVAGYSITEEIFFPMGWSNDSRNILYRFSEDISPIHSSFRLYDISNSTITQVGDTFETLEEGQVLPSYIPLPPSINELMLDSFSGTLAGSRNPIHDQWVAMTMQVFDTAFLPVDDAPQEAFSVINFLWNYETNQTIALDRLFDGTSRVYFVDWSSDGQSMLVSIQGGRVGIIQFDVVDGVGAVLPVDMGDLDNRNRLPKLLLDVEDMIIVTERDEQTRDQVYYIGQIWDGQWYDTEFFRLPATDFSNPGNGDWFITASEQERAQLSCLFDQTLPHRLNVGNRGRVAFTDGSASRLRDEASLGGAELTLMPEGTEFDVIGGAYCADEYRWLQLQLEDGTVGWAVEASTQEYWLEPLSNH